MFQPWMGLYIVISHKSRETTMWEMCNMYTCQKSQVKGTEHILLHSFSAIIDVWRPLMTWLWIDSAPRAWERQACPAVRSPRRGWLRSDTLRAPLQLWWRWRQPAGRPASPHAVWSVSPACSTGSRVWQCRLQGSDGPLMGPSAQHPHEGR